MKKLLATSALAIVAMSGAASAQSVLERVLGQIDNATNLASVNGTFANIAENIGTQGTTNVYVDGTGDLLTQAEYDALAASEVQTDYTGTYATTVADTYYVDVDTGVVLTKAEYDALSAVDQAGYSDMADGTDQLYFVNDAGEVITKAEYDAMTYANDAALQTALGSYTAESIATGPVEGINGSINNSLDGIDAATQEAIASATVSATEWNMPTVDLGDMATTALGAVNTGDITLGVNSAVDEASTSTTAAVSAVMNQLGGSADTGAIVLNVASNMTGVNGSINNVMNEVNGSIGNLSTTALGAVNTGTIVSGVDAAVAGIVGASAGQ
ncbi:hypothetical protein AAFO90_23550 [Phaeobacter sp. CAU 1743]|uniref:hypothetical protein n=1 Tax=Phaeobacter sp. CAU 1743 TaxID=3140367 RepID=UPI00325ABBC4